MKTYINKYEFTGVLLPQTKWQIDLIDQLYDVLEQFEWQNNEEIVFDAVSIRCEYSQYDSLEDFNKQNATEYIDVIDISENRHTVLFSDKTNKILVSND